MLNEFHDLWKEAFPVVTELDLSEYNWHFSNLEDAFAEGGVLEGEEKVFIFGCAEPLLILSGGRPIATYMPVVSAIVSPFPPSDKVGIISLQEESEEIIDMEHLNMCWAPYIPPRGSSGEKLAPLIFVLSRAQRETDLDHFELDPSSHYYVPYFYDPFMVEETQQCSVVDILYQTEAGTVVCEFDWMVDELEEFSDELIAAGELSRDHEDAFKEFVKKKVQEGQKANSEATQKQIQAQEELKAEGKVAAFESMRFYKFYPVDTPDASSCAKSSYINRYYGKAHQVF